MSKVSEHIIQASRRGERVAQYQLYDMFAPRVFGVCLRYARTREEADDWAQDSWVTAFAKLGQFAGTGDFGAWLRRLTVNTCLQNLRKHRPLLDAAVNARLAAGETLLPADLQVAPDVFAHMSADELVQHINSLPEGYRLIFNLVAIEGYSHAEAATALGITESSSRSQLTRARSSLQKRLSRILSLSL